MSGIFMVKPVWAKIAKKASIAIVLLWSQEASKGAWWQEAMKPAGDQLLGAMRPGNQQEAMYPGSQHHASWWT